jgi:hypothetical protein
MDGVSTRAVLDGLTAEGFRVTAAYLMYLTRERVIPPPAKMCGALVWGPGDIARIRSVLYRRGRGPAGREATRCN